MYIWLQYLSLPITLRGCQLSLLRPGSTGQLFKPASIGNTDPWPLYYNGWDKLCYNGWDKYDILLILLLLPCHSPLGHSTVLPWLRQTRYFSYSPPPSILSLPIGTYHCANMTETNMIFFLFSSFHLVIAHWGIDWQQTHSKPSFLLLVPPMFSPCHLSLTLIVFSM